MFNEGLCKHRLTDSSNVVERDFVEAWEKLNPKNGLGTLEYLLAKRINHPCGEVTDRDRQVAATVIQWLGSPCGQDFVEGVLGLDMDADDIEDFPV